MFNSRRTVFAENWVWGCSLSSEVILSAVVLGSFLTTRSKVRWSLSDNFEFRPDLCFAETFYFLFITFETVPVETSNIWAALVMLAPTIQAPTIWTLLKFERSANMGIINILNIWKSENNINFKSIYQIKEL